MSYTSSLCSLSRLVTSRSQLWRICATLHTSEYKQLQTRSISTGAAPINVNTWSHLARYSGNGHALSSQHIINRLRKEGDASRTVRYFSSASEEKSKETLSEAEQRIIKELTDWLPIYRFTWQPHLQLLSRFKVVQTGVLVIGSPLALALYSGGLVSGQLVVALGSMTIFAMGVLAAISHIARRIVGVVSIHRDGDVIRIGHLTFWGRRQNTVWHIDEVVGPSDLGESANAELLLRVGRTGGPEYFLLPSRWGEIVDHDKFFEIFGSVH